MKRIIRRAEDAERAVRDLTAKLAETEIGRRRVDADHSNELMKLKISLHPDWRPFDPTRTYWLENQDDCAGAVSDLQYELGELLDIQGLSDDVKEVPHLRLVHSATATQIKEPAIGGITAAQGKILDSQILEIHSDTHEIKNLCDLLHQYLLRQLEWNDHDAQTMVMFEQIIDTIYMIRRRSHKIVDSVTNFDDIAVNEAIAA